MTAWFEAHRETLEKALETAASRDYWTAYPEMPSGRIYGETAKDDGAAAFKACLGNTFEIDGHPSNGGAAGKESSPFGLPLNISYPTADVEQLMAAAKDAGKAWGRTSIEMRTGVCLELLDRLNKRSFEIANAVMHTTGQAFMMAFQAGGPHAQDRGLEAVTYAFEEMTRTPAKATWTKPQTKALNRRGQTRYGAWEEQETS